MPRLLLRIATSVLTLVLPAAMLTAQNVHSQASPGWNQDEALRIVNQVRKAIVTLPDYGVFDDIHFGIKEKTIILTGYASRPILKSSTERVVKKIEGVQGVDNQIEVLPLSRNDDRIRAGVYARIYGYAPLQKYTNNRGGGRYLSLTRIVSGITNDPPIGYHVIHIIVNNGNVTLAGVVDNANDLALAEIRANMTPGAFSVVNDLMVAKE